MKRRLVSLSVIFIIGLVLLLTRNSWQPWLLQQIPLIRDNASLLEGIGAIIDWIVLGVEIAILYIGWMTFREGREQTVQEEPEHAIERVSAESLRKELVRGGRIAWVNRGDTDAQWLRTSERVAIMGQRKLGKTREAIELIQRTVAGRNIAVFRPTLHLTQQPTQNLTEQLRPLLFGQQTVILFVDDLPWYYKGESLKRLGMLLTAMQALCETVYLIATVRNDQLQQEHSAWLDRFEVVRHPLSPLDDEETGQFVANAFAEFGMTGDDAIHAAFVSHNDGTPERPLNVLRQLDNEPKAELTESNVVERMEKEIAVTWAENRKRIARQQPFAGRLVDALTVFHAAGIPPHRQLLTGYAITNGAWVIRSATIRRAWRLLHSGYDINASERLVSYPDVAVEGLLTEIEAREQFTDWLTNSNKPLAKQLLNWHRAVAQRGDASSRLAGNLMWPNNASGATYSHEAHVLLLQATEWQPEDAVAWYRLGVSYKKNQQHQQAITAYQQAILLDASDAYPHNGLGNVYHSLGQLDDATAAYQQAILLDASYAAPHNGLGHVYHSLGQSDDAIAAYQQAISLDASYAYPYNSLGNVYRSLGQLDDAIAAYQQAISLDASFAHPHNGLGNVYHDLGQSDDAIAAYQQAISLDASFAHPHNGLGYLYRSLGQSEDAIAAYQQAISLDASFAHPHNGLGNVYRRLNQPDKAIRSFQQAVKLDPQDAANHVGLASAYRQAGDLDLATATLLQAISLDADDANAHTGLAAIYRVQQETDLYKHHVAQAQANTSELSPYNRACLEAIAGNADAAFELLKQAVEARPGSIELAKTDPDFDFVRALPQFQALLGTVQHPTVAP